MTVGASVSGESKSGFAGGAVRDAGDSDVSGDSDSKLNEAGFYTYGRSPRLIVIVILGSVVVVIVVY